jgi:hypothetical protein
MRSLWGLSGLPLTFHELLGNLQNYFLFCCHQQKRGDSKGQQWDV